MTGTFGLSKRLQFVNYDHKMGLFRKKNQMTSQEQAQAALLSRTFDFKRDETYTRIGTSGGVAHEGYFEADLNRAWSFVKKHGNGRGYPDDAWTGVGYLVPEGASSVAVVVDGTTIDHLQDDSALKVREKISEPTPVKVRIFVVGKAPYSKLNVAVDGKR